MRQYKNTEWDIVLGTLWTTLLEYKYTSISKMGQKVANERKVFFCISSWKLFSMRFTHF